MGSFVSQLGEEMVPSLPTAPGVQTHCLQNLQNYRQPFRHKVKRLTGGSRGPGSEASPPRVSHWWREVRAWQGRTVSRWKLQNPVFGLHPNLCWSLPLLLCLETTGAEAISTPVFR